MVTNVNDGAERARGIGLVRSYLTDGVGVPDEEFVSVNLDELSLVARSLSSWEDGPVTVVFDPEAMAKVYDAASWPDLELITDEAALRKAIWLEVTREVLHEVEVMGRRYSEIGVSPEGYFYGRVLRQK